MSTARVSRNELCPCRSGKKYKHCCLLTGRNSPVAVLDGPKSNRISALFPLAGLSSDRPTLRQEWKELHLDVPLRDGTGLHIVLFHSECWLRDQRVGVGHGMDVNLPQISYQGAAILTAVQTAEWAPSAEGELKAVFHRTVDNDGGVLVLGARRTRSRGNFAERCANLRLVSVEFTERRGPLARQVNLELLRPISWIRQQNVRVGGTVVLDEPKEGVQGRATVRAIHPCPSRKSLLEKMQVGEFKPWSCRIGDLKISQRASRSASLPCIRSGLPTRGDGSPPDGWSRAISSTQTKEQRSLNGM